MDIKKAVKDFLFEQACITFFGFKPIHLTISHNIWTIARWDAAQYPELKNDQNLLRKLEKIWLEIADTDRKGTIEPPLSCSVINGIIPHRELKYPGPLSFEDKLNNILTNLGMAEMGKRSTAESATTNTHHAVGTGAVAEAVTDTVLGTEVGRVAIGTRAVVNQTERYGSAFADTDIAPVPSTITEAGVLTLAAGGVLILRVTAAGQVLDTGNIITVQTNVSHQNGTQT